MIDFPVGRRRAVRRLLDRLDGDDTYEATHRVLVQSYKAINQQYIVAQCIRALRFLFTGEPIINKVEEIDGLAEAALIFRETPTGRRGPRPSRQLLLEHARRIFAVESLKRGGYIDVEDGHLTLLGGRLLFTSILRSLIEPYRPDPVGSISFHEATVLDVAMWIRPEAIEAALAEGADHWEVWDQVTR